MIASELEKAVLDQLRPELERSGYEIFLDVSPSILPKNIKGYIPDFVAKKGDEYIAFEVKSSRHPSIHSQLLKLKRLFDLNDHWKLEVIYGDEQKLSSGPKVQNKRDILLAVENGQKLAKEGFKREALLGLWAAFEAAARYRHSKIFSKPQSPGRIITVLAERGPLSISQANQLRNLVTKRNWLIHGGLDAEVSQNDIALLVSSIKETLGLNDPA